MHILLAYTVYLIIAKTAKDGLKHRPVAEREAHAILIERKTTLNTAQVKNERTVRRFEKT